MSRVGEVPVYEQRDDKVDAKVYNLWRRAKLHFGSPIRIAVPGLAGMVMILEENEWVCADRTQDDLPVLAWVEFEDKGRDSLHTPVRCKLNYYHFMASKVRRIALEQTEKILQKRLREEV